MLKIILLNKFLTSIGLNKDLKNYLIQQASNISYKGAEVKDPPGEEGGTGEGGAVLGLSAQEDLQWCLEEEVVPAQRHHCPGHRGFHASGLVRRAYGKARPGRARSVQTQARASARMRR